MTEKSALNLTAVMTIVIALLFTFFTWTSNAWVENREKFETQHAVAIDKLTRDVSSLEKEYAVRWKYVEQNLVEINATLKELSKRK